MQHLFLGLSAVFTLVSLSLNFRQGPLDYHYLHGHVAFEIKARDPEPFELFHKIGVAAPDV